jgi:type I restriction enzyme S subunit
MIQTEIEKRFPGDHPRTVAVREYLTSACEQLVNRRLADPKFIIELTSGSDQKFWACVSEALIADRLRDKDFGARDKRGVGPDFLVMNGTQRVWIEVVCPESIGIPGEWLNPLTGNRVGFPHETILLRWMSAIKAKAEALIGSDDGKQAGYANTGLVVPDDAYVIAVNGCRLRGGQFPALIGISQFPFAAEAVFPIGPLQLKVDRETLQVIDRGHQHRPFVLNKNGAKVPADTFLDPRFNQISAIWAVDLDGGSAIGNSEPMIVIHNPYATSRIPLGFLPADDEYEAVAQGDEILLCKARQVTPRS